MKKRIVKKQLNRSIHSIHRRYLAQKVLKDSLGTKAQLWIGSKLGNQKYLIYVYIVRGQEGSKDYNKVPITRTDIPMKLYSCLYWIKKHRFECGQYEIFLQPAHSKTELEIYLGKS